MARLVTLLALLLTVAGAAMAHNGVKNPAVMARMDAMSAIGAATKVLGQMARGSLAFDVDRARMAAQDIAKHAAETPALFRAKEDDPKSEALPVIWETFDDFTAKSKDLEDVAKALAASVASVDDVRGAMKGLGDTCKACHQDYRQ